jgi:hypothetical protein
MQPPCRAWALADVERNRRHCRRRRRRRRARDGCSGRTGRIDRAFLYPPATRLLDRSKRVPPCERVQNTFPSENAGREKRKDNLSMKKKAHARAQARQKKTVTHGCAPGPEAAGSSDRLGDEAGRPPEPEDQDPRHPRPHLVSHTPLSLHGCTAAARSWLLRLPAQATVSDDVPVEYSNLLLPPPPPPPLLHSPRESQSRPARAQHLSKLLLACGPLAPIPHASSTGRCRLTRILSSPPHLLVISDSQLAPPPPPL